METDQDIHERVARLVDAEHQLRAGPVDDQTRAELAQIEARLDQCWDLLRQRQALRESGGSDQAAHVRPASEVEGYLQ